MQKYVILITAITHFNFLLVLLVKTHVKSMPGRFPELLKKKKKEKKNNHPLMSTSPPCVLAKLGRDTVKKARPKVHSSLKLHLFRAKRVLLTVWASHT